MHADAIVAIECGVSHFARQRMPKVDELPLSVADATRTEPNDRSIVFLRRQFDDVCDGKGTAGDRKPIHHEVLGPGQLADSVSEKLFDGRGESRKARVVALRSDQVGDSISGGSGAFTDLESSALQERVDHLEKEKRISADLGE
jgi:hypothetical protein